MHVLTICMFVFQAIAINLLAFLGLRYRNNVASIWRNESKAAWSRIFLLFLLSAFATEALTWTQGYIKCLDTSHALARLLPAAEAAHVCDMWVGIGTSTKKALFTLYLIFELIAVCSFQALVLERYRKVAHLFPDWTSKRALPIYTAAYIPIGICACMTSLLEFWLSPETIIERTAAINTISSAFYCIWIVLTGLTDAILSFLIVSKVRRSKRDLYDDGEHKVSHHSASRDAETTELTSLDRQQFSRLRQLQVFFVIIVLFDVSILGLTALKKLNGNGIHGHVFAYEVASIEIACTLLHCTLTLCFMQLLGVILRQSQPQFEFVINSQKARRLTIDANTATTMTTSMASTTSGMTEDLEEYNNALNKQGWKTYSVVTRTTDLGSQPPSPAADAQVHEISMIEDGKT